MRLSPQAKYRIFGEVEGLFLSEADFWAFGSDFMKNLQIGKSKETLQIP